MDTSSIKTTVLLIATIGFLLLSFITTDIIRGHLFTSLGIITASLTFHTVTTQKQVKNENNRNTHTN
jgi:hypothetical protein